MSANAKESSPSLGPVIAVALVLGAAGPVCYYFLVSKIKNNSNDKPPRLQRQWSFTSDNLKAGIFPPSVKAPDTIINTALYYNGEPPSVQDLVEHVVTPMLSYDRFAKIPCPKRGVGMVASPNPYQPSDLVTTMELKGGRGQAELQAAINSMLSNKLDVGRNSLPWWELVRIVPLNSNNKTITSTRSVVLLRVHHCLGDGLSLVKAFTDSCIQTKEGKPAQEGKVTKALMNRGANMKMPSFASILSSAFQVATLPASKFDTDTALFKKDITYSSNRSVVLLPDLPLQYIKDCKDQAPFPTTVNDVLMCIISQTLHDYCVQQNDDKVQQSNLQCRALLPVSLPRPRSVMENKATALQNAFCMVSADLNLGPHATVLSRLQAIHDTTTRLKQSPIAAVQLWMQDHIVSKMPTSMARQTAHDIFSRHSVVLTNVPGPDQSSYVGGKEVVDVQLFFPNVIPQVDLLTYAGTVYGNIIFDTEDWPNATETLAKLYAKTLVALGKECGVEQIPDALLDAVKA